MVGKISVNLDVASGHASFLIGLTLTACPEDLALPPSKYLQQGNQQPVIPVAKTHANSA